MPEGACVGGWLGLRVALGWPGGAWGAWGAGAWEEVGGVWEDLVGPGGSGVRKRCSGLMFSSVSAPTML